MAIFGLSSQVLPGAPTQNNSLGGLGISRRIAGYSGSSSLCGDYTMTASKGLRGILGRMGRLLNVRDFVIYVDSNKGQKSERGMYEDYAYEKGLSSDKEVKPLLLHAKHLELLEGENANILGSIKPTVVLSYPKGEQFLKRDWGFPTGVFKTYIKDNSGLINILIGFMGGVVAIIGVYLTYRGLSKK